MPGLRKIEGYTAEVINICPQDTEGEVVEVSELYIQLPKVPAKKDILFHDKKKEDQMWRRIDVPSELLRVRSMDEWAEKPKEFRQKHSKYIEIEFQRRRNGVWFMNNGIPTYITGRQYMLLQWSKMDIGYPSYLKFQGNLFIHFAACEYDPRSLGQVFTKCRRSGYTNISASILADEGTQVKEKLLGIQSKTGKDAQENIFMKKVVPMYKSYPFFFKPIQDGTTNPRMELAFREPSKRITKNNKTSSAGEALDTIINWKNTTNNAYDGEKLHMLYLDEAGKWEKPSDIREAWRIERTCLIVGRRIVGKCLMGSTVNPLDKGGKEFRDLYYNSDPNERNQNGRTKSGLYKIFVPAYNALEGFFDKYGNPIVEDPKSPVETIDGDFVDIGAKTYLKNERQALMTDAYELNEVIRQFPFNEDEAFRDSTKSTIFNIAKIYEQLGHNQELYPSPIVSGNFIWAEKNKKVVFSPDPNGRWKVAWLPPEKDQNQYMAKYSKISPPENSVGVGGVDSYDLDATVDGRGSKGACHLYVKFNMKHNISNMFVAEYASRPPLAKIFYEDILMAAFFYGFPILIENNKYGIARHFEARGFDNYLMDRPEHLKNGSSSSKTKGIPSNSQDIIDSHAQAIEAFIHNHVGYNHESENMGRMYFNRTLEDWIGYRIENRTKYDLTISAGLALMAAQKFKPEKPKTNFNEKVFLRRFKPIQR
tara:strand:- start:2864 stop:4981 length:2118 start_codon:yes stop_codon:yes gene_type:complete